MTNKKTQYPSDPRGILLNPRKHSKQELEDHKRLQDDLWLLDPDFDFKNKGGDE